MLPLSGVLLVVISSVPNSSVAWLGILSSVMLAIFCRWPSKISDTMFNTFLCLVLFPLNISVSSSFPCCRRLRFSSIFLTCCFSDLLDHCGIFDSFMQIFLAGGSLTTPISGSLVPVCSQLLPGFSWLLSGFLVSRGILHQWPCELAGSLNLAEPT